MAQGSDREQHDPGDEDDRRLPLATSATTCTPALYPAKAGTPALVAGESRIMMFRVTPGESIHVETPQQRELRMRQRLPRPSWLRRAWSWIAAWWCGR